MSIRKRAVAMAAAVSIIGAGATGLIVAPSASADARHGYVDGRGWASDDWQDEAFLSTHDHSHSNAVALWQTVLYADGAQYRDRRGHWHTFRQSDVDGWFGEVTKAATRDWQREHRVRTTGTVTSWTWSAAQDELRGPNRRGWVTYDGSAHEVFFQRGRGGAYFVELNGRWVRADYYERG
jgi:peptidoglycan hydrolase-like protein with peptidoglycan-binding domain